MKKNIAVVMGGYSSEFQISINSGTVVCNALDKNSYNIYPIHILKEGWYFIPDERNKIPVNRHNFSFETENGVVIPDAVFNAIHGTPGEDGYLQAYWELLEIPHTGCDYYASALSFNKRDCLSVLKNFQINCANSFYINKGDHIDKAEIIKKVGLPCFVKPNRSGSSFGVSKVHTMEEIDSALEKAFTEDSQVIVETALIGDEVQVGVFNNDTEIIALPPTEIVTENDFFDYGAKYLGESEEITPARISEELTTTLQNEAKRIYKLLNMKGITRSDFIIQNEKPYFLEINTNPGLSTESIIPKQVRAARMSLTEFFGILTENALKQKASS